MGCVKIAKITSLTCLQNFNQSLDINYKLIMLKRLFNKELTTQQFTKALKDTTTSENIVKVILNQEWCIKNKVKTLFDFQKVCLLSLLVVT